VWIEPGDVSTRPQLDAALHCLRAIMAELWALASQTHWRSPLPGPVSKTHPFPSSGLEVLYTELPVRQELPPAQNQNKPHCTYVQVGLAG
jgi:hypothetical protein